MKILITTVFFPPQNAIASQRPYSWALAWSRAGHDVTVLTIEKDRSKSDLSPMPTEGFTVIEVASGRLLEWLRSRRRSGQKPISGPSDEHTTKTRVSRTAEILSSFRVWTRGRGWLSSVRWPDIFDFWVWAAFKKIPKMEFDLIVSTFGPPASLALGYKAKRMSPNATWVCDFRDLWTENHVYPGLFPFTFFERIAEAFYLRRADGVTTVSEGLARSLRRKVSDAKKVAVFENGFLPSELALLDSSSVFPNRGKINLVYTGSLHPQQRNPRPLFEAISRLSEADRNRVQVSFAGSREAFLVAMISEFGIETSVRIVGPLTRELSLRYQRDADVLLFFEAQREPAQDGVLTGKLFEYLATGRPIWAIGIDENSTVGSLIESNECGVAFGGDVENLLLHLRKLLDSGPAAPRDVTEPNDISLQFNRIEIADRLLDWARSLRQTDWSDSGRDRNRRTRPKTSI